MKTTCPYCNKQFNYEESDKFIYCNLRSKEHLPIQEEILNNKHLKRILSFTVFSVPKLKKY